MAPRPALVLPLLVLAACAGTPDQDGKQDDTSGTDPCPVVVVDPGALDFANLALGSSATDTVTLLNNCTGSTTPLTIQASVDDEAFTVDPALSSVAPGEVATLNVTALVADYAEAAGSLALVTSDPANPLITVALTAIADPDQDGDGSESVEAAGDDCDDADATVAPDAQEVWYDGIDQDCDGNDDDQDGDGFALDVDCDDAEATVFPGADEVWYDGVDADCAGDDDFDQDGDGYQQEADCDDLNSAISPGSTEVCDSLDVDENCDGTADDATADAATMTTFYADADSDGYGDAGTPVQACDLPTGASADATDCDDRDARISPAGLEVCDEGNADDDCDSLADDADASVDASGYGTFYADTDGDGYGDASATTLACDLPAGYLTDTSDCDDTESAVNPGGTEVCEDGIDQDCSGIDETCGLSGDYDPDSGYYAKLYGAAANDAFGETLTSGDFDGDGAGDLVVGASNAEEGAYTSYGVLYGYYGPLTAGAQVATTADVSSYNTSSSYASSFGSRAHNVGDVNADGRDDLVVGLGSYSGALLWYGGDTGALADSTYDLSLGCANATPGGNLYTASAADEFLCGTPLANSSRGETYVYSGSSAVATLVGEDAGDYSGLGLAGGGDVDGDGFDDLWVGAGYHDASAGRVYLVYGPTSGSVSLATADATIDGAQSSALFGWTMDMPGDVDGDGRDDVIGYALAWDESSADQGAGFVYTSVTTGAYTTSDADARILGEDAGDLLSSYIQSYASGDVNGDGDVDLLFGCYANDGGGADAGAAWLVYGPLIGTVDLDGGADARWGGDDAADVLGYAVTIIPDADGDGADEIAIGAYGGDHGSSTDVGAVWIWAGS